MVGSPPPRFQFETVPVVWSRLVPSSNEGFTQKLPNSKFATGARATDKSSMTMTPVMLPEPPETSSQRMVTAPDGTTTEPFRFVNVESSIVVTHPGLVVPVVTKWVEPPTWLPTPLKKVTVKRISGPLRLYISYHWRFKVSPSLALRPSRTSDYQSP